MLTGKRDVRVYLMVLRTRQNHEIGSGLICKRYDSELFLWLLFKKEETDCSTMNVNSRGILDDGGHVGPFSGLL